ncbi:hypothetical protein NDU88_007112 [Pleurodeles waltl]|uniref:Uncharacterized protein n=1 Tax=Pleurodeles waltl TaxID=8319 RepID=A0AAV7UQZ9_PLEWA|nr:hypothetical protein NDU88_007112 [Pleurodeles waltl]
MRYANRYAQGKPLCWLACTRHLTNSSVALIDAHVLPWLHRRSCVLFAPFEHLTIGALAYVIDFASG